MVAVSGQHGLFKTDNGGRGWQLTGFPARSTGFAIKPYQVALSPSFGADETLFVSTGQSLQRSRDGGDSWQQLSAAGFSLQAQQVALSPNFAADATLLVSTPDTIYRSTDGGDSWTAVLSSETESSTSDVLAFALDGETAFARFGYGSSLYRSDDGGQSWQARPSGQDEYFSIISAAVDADGALSAAVEYDRKLLQSPPWQNLSESLPAELTGLNSVAHHPDGSLYIAGPGGVFSSDDSGQSWQALATAGLPPGATITKLATSDSALMVALSNGSLYSLTAGESGWKDVSIIK
jgi:photosystem II stability/assembly factor-like uncharacterized protein